MRVGLQYRLSAVTYNPYCYYCRRDCACLLRIIVSFISLAQKRLLESLSPLIDPSPLYAIGCYRIHSRDKEETPSRSINWTMCSSYGRCLCRQSFPFGRHLRCFLWNILDDSPILLSKLGNTEFAQTQSIVNTALNLALPLIMCSIASLAFSRGNFSTRQRTSFCLAN